MGKSYKVKASDWDGHLWAVEIDGLPRGHLGVTQASKIRDIDTIAREIIVYATGTTPDSFDIEVTYDLPAEMVGAMSEIEEMRAELRRLTATMQTRRREVVCAARGLGFTMRDTGELLQVSHQRVAQILKEDELAEA